MRHWNDLQTSQGKWQQISERLEAWKEQDVVSNQMLWDMEKFTKGTIMAEELERLQESFGEVREELEEQRQEAQMSLRKVKKEEKEAREELKELKQGKKAYPKELEEARYELRNRLHEKCGKFVNVQILADLLDVKDETMAQHCRRLSWQQQDASDRGTEVCKRSDGTV